MLLQWYFITIYIRICVGYIIYISSKRFFFLVQKGVGHHRWRCVFRFDRFTIYPTKCLNSLTENSIIGVASSNKFDRISQFDVRCTCFIRFHSLCYGFLVVCICAVIYFHRIWRETKVNRLCMSRDNELFFFCFLLYFIHAEKSKKRYALPVNIEGMDTKSTNHSLFQQQQRRKTKPKLLLVMPYAIR